MAYDPDLADALRERLSGVADLTEQPMFGGLAFMIDGRMVLAVSGRGGLLLRAIPERADELLADPRAQPFVMRGRELSGWLHVDVDASAPQAELDRWIAVGRDAVASS